MHSRRSSAASAPSFPDPLASETSFSFPSGHSSVAIAFYGALALVLARLLPRWRARLALALAAAALVAVIGLSRLYLGVHYLSDVLAGFAAGLAWFSDLRARTRRPRSPPLTLSAPIRASDHTDTHGGTGT